MKHKRQRQGVSAVLQYQELPAAFIYLGNQEDSESLDDEFKSFQIASLRADDFLSENESGTWVPFAVPFVTGIILDFDTARSLQAVTIAETNL